MPAGRRVARLGRLFENPERLQAEEILKIISEVRECSGIADGVVGDRCDIPHWILRFLD